MTGAALWRVDFAETVAAQPCVRGGRADILGVSACLLGGRSTVGHVALDHVIGVRIPASQPIL